MEAIRYSRPISTIFREKIYLYISEQNMKFHFLKCFFWRIFLPKTAHPNKWFSVAMIFSRYKDQGSSPSFTAKNYKKIFFLIAVFSWQGMSNPPSVCLTRYTNPLIKNPTAARGRLKINCDPPIFRKNFKTQNKPRRCSTKSHFNGYKTPNLKNLVIHVIVR